MTGQKTPTALGTEKIGKLLMQYAIPAIIAMTASSLYNMVDSIFIGHGVGAMAISGLALTFPLMNLAAAFGSLVGVGAATLISVKLSHNHWQRHFSDQTAFLFLPLHSSVDRIVSARLLLQADNLRCQVRQVVRLFLPDHLLLRKCILFVRQF